MLTPSEVSAKLQIQRSRLRKYSALLEQEGIQFKRTHKNARLYTDSEYITIESIIATYVYHVIADWNQGDGNYAFLIEVE